MTQSMTLDRRKALAAMAGLFGATLVPGLARAMNLSPDYGFKPSKQVLSPAHRALVTAYSERILPTTDTPGAIAAGVPEYIEMMLADWFTAPEHGEFLKGLDAIEAHSRSVHKKSFAKLTPALQDAVITDLMNAKVANAPNRYFDTSRQMVVSGYYSSEIGMSVERIYLPVPGEYNGNYPYEGRVFTG